MEKHIIVGIGGIGKTTLARKNQDVIDMEIREYKYVDWKPDYNLYDWYKIKEHIINDNWFKKYLKHIKNEIENGNHKIVFIWMNNDVIEYLENEKIDYTMAFWDKNQEGMEEFLQELYTKRGNTQTWINRVLNYLNEIYEYARKNNINSIILKKNENIEQILKEKLKWI